MAFGYRSAANSDMNRLEAQNIGSTLVYYTSAAKTLTIYSSMLLPGRYVVVNTNAQSSTRLTISNQTINQLIVTVFFNYSSTNKQAHMQNFTVNAMSTGTITTDIAYGGAAYVLVDIFQAG